MKTDDAYFIFKLSYNFGYRVSNEIDLYAQDCIRVIISRTHKKSKYNVKYEKIKELEYKSLVNEYYKSTR